jgi:1,4-dihydroxy-6-naphthoate synthase
VPFDRILDAVEAGRYEGQSIDAGLVIHEGQLTYADRGLHLWMVLGAWFKQRTGLPLPLGGNVVRKDLGETLVRQVSRDLRASIVYGLAHRAAALEHAQQYARGLDRARTDTFVGMYVNDYTVDYGPTGRAAVQRLMDDAHAARLIPAVRAEFVED